MTELTDEELAFLLDILTNIQLSGTPEQVRQTLALIDSIRKKLSANSEDA